MSRRYISLAVASLLSAPALTAQSISDKVQVHGYLTQGFGASDSLQLLGISNKGTADYRAAALQLRAALTTQDIAVVQLANRRMGESALNSVGNDVQLQWAYYQRRLPGGLSAKLGRSPLPRGIYNEVRKVGTVLPFYRAPYNFYTESFETVDGGLLSHDASIGAWGLETSAFVGNFAYVQKTVSGVYSPRIAAVNGKPTLVGVDRLRDTTFILDRRGDRGVGGQVWLSTPIDGLRVGGGTTRFSLNDLHELSGRSGRVASTISQAAVDGNFTRFQLRGEWEQQHSGEFLYTAHYQQVGLRLTNRVSMNAQREQANVHVAGRPLILGVPFEQSPVSRSSNEYARDVALGTTFAFRPNVILKLEGHENRGVNYDRSTSGAATGRYFISSLALSF